MSPSIFNPIFVFLNNLFKEQDTVGLWVGALLPDHSWVGMYSSLIRGDARISHSVGH